MFFKARLRRFCVFAIKNTYGMTPTNTHTDCTGHFKRKNTCNMTNLAFFRHAQTDHVIYGEKSATNTHTDCTRNTHTDGPKHTHGLHTNAHILLPIAVFAIKTGTKTHTYL